MLQWSLVFFVIALVAAALGFGGLAGDAAMVGRVLFFIFLVVFLISLIAGLMRGRGLRSV